MSYSSLALRTDYKSLEASCSLFRDNLQPRQPLNNRLLGAGYGVVHAATGAPAISAGPLYGLGTYALNFMGLGPATGLMPGPWKQEPPDVAREMMMHAVYGAVTAVVADRLLQKMDGQQLPSRQDMPTARQVQEEFFEEEYHEEEMPERMP